MTYLNEKFRRFADQTALVHKGESYSYTQLADQAKAYTNALADIAPGSVVAILDDYSFASIALFLALFEKKTIIVPVTSTLEHVQQECVTEAFADYAISFDGTDPVIRKTGITGSHPMIEALQSENASGLVLFSSGSTGKPKAMIHNLDNLINSYKDKREKKMNMLVFLMFDHIGGLNTLFNVLSMGAALIIPEDRDAGTICTLIEKYRIAVLPSSPTFLNLILMSGEHQNHNLKSLRMITYGTEAMPESLLIRLKEAFPRVRLLQTFGTSETGISTTASKSSDSLYMKIDDADQEYKIVDNELWLRSKTQVLGYLNASMDAFTEDGWFKTGDLVEQVEDGYLKIIGRNKEVINVGGEKVLPAEVESVILSHPDIDDCMVHGAANVITGETVVVDVVSHTDKDARTLKKELRSFCRDKLAAYKIPTKVNAVDRTNFSDRFKKIRIAS